MGALESIAEHLKRKAAQKRESTSLDALTKQAALRESGYETEYQPGKFGGLFGGGYTMRNDPSFKGIKNLQRQKLEGEVEDLDKKRQIRNEFYESRKSDSGSTVNNKDPLIYDPLSGTMKRNPGYFNEERERRKFAIKREEEPVPVSEIGRDTLAEESIINIPKARKILFPSGKSDSFRRDIAFESKGLFGIKLPLSAESQNTRRWIGQALSAKQLIQTGVAAREEEYERLGQSYLAGFTSNPDALFPALQELQDFYVAYRRSLRSRGKEGFDVSSMSNEELENFANS